MLWLTAEWFLCWFQDNHEDPILFNVLLKQFFHWNSEFKEKAQNPFVGHFLKYFLKIPMDKATEVYLERFSNKSQ